MKNKFQPIYRGLVIFDVDGVLADFEGAFCEAFGDANRHLYNLEERYPEQADTVSEWVLEPENYVELSPIFGGVLFMNQVVEKGYYVVIMTSRPSSMQKVTERWMRRYNIYPHNLIFCQSKAEGVRRLSRDLELHPIMFVDDSPRQLEAVSQYMGREGCIAWAQPWNTEWENRAEYDPTRMKIVINKRGGENEGKTK